MPKTIIMHVGPKSAPAAIYLPAGSFGWEAADDLTFRAPWNHPETGTACRRKVIYLFDLLGACRNTFLIGGRELCRRGTA